MDQQTTAKPEGQVPPALPPKKRKWLRIAKKIAWSIVIFFLLIFILLKLPAVQDFMRQQVVDSIHNHLGTEVKLDGVRLKWLDRLEINNLFIRDLHQDTLINSGNITADFNLNPYVFWTRGLEIEALDIQGAHFNISKYESDSLTNLNWAISKLFPPKAPKKKNKKGLPLNLDQLSLVDVSFSKLDSSKGNYLSAYVPKAQVWVDDLNLAKEQININTINIERPHIVIKNWIPPGGFPVLVDSILNQVVEPTGLAINVGEIRLSGGKFTLDNVRKASNITSPTQLDLKHLKLYDIQVEIDSFKFLRDTFTGSVNWIAAKDKSGFKLERLSAKEAFLCSQSLKLNDLSIITPTSHLGDTLHLHYSRFLDWENFENKVRMDARLHKADVTLQDIIAFAPKLNNNPFFDKNRNTNLKIEGRFRGKVNNLKGKDINIQLVDGTKIKGNFFSNNLTRPQETFLRLELDQLRTTMQTVRQIIPNFKAPKNFDNLGQLNFGGEFTGFTYDFVANGDLRTDIGRITLDMHMLLNDGPENAEYSGNINLIDFDLGTWLQQPDLGIVNFSSNVEEGVGISGSKMSAKLTAAIESFGFKNYTYQNANITGELNQRFFNGNLSIQDDNIDFAFNGELDFRDSLPNFDFKADIKRLALKELNLSKQDLVIASKLDINLRNTTKFSEIEGEAKVNKFLIIKDKIEQYQVDFIHVLSFFNDTGDKVFRLDSDLARGEVRGNFDINQLVASLSSFALRNYPGFASRIGIKPPKKEPDINEFNFDIHIINSKGFNQLLAPKLGTLENIDLSGRYNGVSDSLLINLEVPYVELGNLRFADIYVHIDAIEHESDLDIVIDSTLINGKPQFNTFTLLSILDRDSLNFGITLNTDTPSILDKININGLLSLPDSLHYQLELSQSNLSLMEQAWVIDRGNKIIFGNEEISAHNFSLNNKDRTVKILSHNKQGLRFELEHFDFSYIDHLWKYKPLDFNGDFDMSVQIDNIFKLQGINAAINSDSFYINKDNFGAFKLDVNAPNTKSQLAGILSIESDTSKLQADITFNLADIGKTAFLSNTRPPKRQKNYLNIDIKVDHYPLNIAEYWLREGLSNTIGHFDANLNISGLPKQITPRGFIDVRDGAFFVDALQTRYSFDKSLIVADDRLFDLTGTVIYDKYGNSAVMEGGITHQHIKHLGLNAKMRTRRFLGLDLKEGDNDLFYGKAIASGEVEFTGNFELPNIYVNATVEDSTYIAIPVTGLEEAQDLNFVKFVNKHKNNSATTKEENTKIQGLNLEMDLKITEVADLELIFDEQAGDIIKGQGRGDVRIILPRAGDFQMFGNVTVTHGNYLFTLYELINKDFRIVPGGQITWSGDPLNAQIDIEAEYKDLSTSPYGLIPEYLATQTDDVKALARQSTDVDLLLKLRGELFQPDISFNINFPKLTGQLANITENKLNLLRRDQSEMNRQVFGLIVLGQFMPSDLSINSNELISNTLSEYFSNQVSLLVTELFSEILEDNRTFSSLDFELAINRFSSDISNPNTSTADGRSVEFSFKSGFANDRLTIDVGGNFSFGDVSTSNAGNGTFFGEDIVIEYALNKNRDLKIRLYERREQDISETRRLQVGTGLSWRKEFDTFSEFWSAIKRKKKKKS